MGTREDKEVETETRQPYVAPRIEEVFEFETAALAGCNKEPTAPLCLSNPPTSAS